ncbi:MAG: class I SAM-dependent methyltransferase [Candidatus Paceibacterota bacterium]
MKPKAEQKTTKKFEDNPFEDETVAKQWINSVENEKGRIRERETYPKLKAWSDLIKPKIIVDIGSGQGVCADYVQAPDGKYIGIEPSSVLVERAKELYSRKDREFLVGNAYQLPIQDESADTALSVNVWFHLEDLDLASQELARVLKAGGNFLISTANPNSLDIWRTWYFDAIEDDKKIDGGVNVPVNPMSRNVFYKHTIEEIKSHLTKHGLEITKEEEFGFIEPSFDRPLFINFFGCKKTSRS